MKKNLRYPLDLRRGLFLRAVAVFLFCLGALGHVAADPQSGSSACKPGQKIEIDWHDKWYPGTVKAGVDANGDCFVSYDDYSSAWDARMPLSKIRMRGQSQPLAALPPVAKELWRGNYVCTRAGGSISPAFGFTVHAAGRVTDHQGGNPGTYRIDSQKRTISFTGGGWDGRSGRFTLAESVFTHYQGEREIVTCRPINSAGKPTR